MELGDFLEKASHELHQVIRDLTIVLGQELRVIDITEAGTDGVVDEEDVCVVDPGLGPIVQVDILWADFHKVPVSRRRGSRAAWSNKKIKV